MGQREIHLAPTVLILQNLIRRYGYVKKGVGKEIDLSNGLSQHVNGVLPIRPARKALSYPLLYPEDAE